jgi:hypothetical protein
MYLRLFQPRHFVLAATVFLCHSQFPIASAQASQNTPLVGCEQKLLPNENEKTAEYIRDRFNQYEVISKIDGSGFVLRPPKPNAVHEIYVRTEPDGLSPFRASVWNSAGRSYELYDIGPIHFAGTSKKISLAILDHILNRPDDELVVHYDISRMTIERSSKNLAKSIHETVLSVYKNRKDYLMPADFERLRQAGNFSTNTDVFALFDNDKNKADFSSPAEISKSILATMQITYFRQRNYLIPTAHEILRDAGFYSKGYDLLPFEFRIPLELREVVREGFDQDFDMNTSCEFTRYVRFEGLPQPVHDRFFLQALKTARDRGVTTIFASVDASTLRLFKNKYGFEIQTRLPKITEEREFIIYLRVGSEQFNRTYARLSQSSATVTTKDEDNYEAQ